MSDDMFEHWVSTQAPHLKRTALLLCGDEHDADELVQETVTRVCERWQRVRSLKDPMAYARRTLSNLYLSRWRRRRTESENYHLLVGHSTESASQVIDDRHALAAWLATIGPKQRTAVVLRYYCDLPIPEIARLLNCRETTVRTQVMRALANLRDAANADANLRNEESENGTRHVDQT